MPTSRLLFPALLATLLAGCATMDADQCRKADWRAVGLRDGQNGEPLALLDRRAKDCADNQVAVNRPLYLEGRNLGLPQYCRVDQAARYGVEGKPYHGVCAPGIDGEFRRRHALGWEVHQARSALNNLDGQQRTLESKLARAKNDDERRSVRQELRAMDNDIRRARDRVRDAEWNFDRMR
jgi:hypothetical protein